MEIEMFNHSCLVRGMALVLAAAGCVAEQASDADDVANDGYAESLYSEFSAFADSSVTFSVATKSEGRLTRREGGQLSVSGLVGSPSHEVMANVSAVKLHSVSYVDLLQPDPEVGGYLADQLQALEYEDASVRNGRYRVLAVTTSIGGEVRHHDAMEICWNPQGRCAVLDPAMMFLEDQVNGVRERRAAGWAPVVTEAVEARPSPMDATASKAAAATCHIRGTSKTSETVSDPAFTQSANRGAWKINVGALSSTISCVVVNGVCKPSASNTSGTSSVTGASASRYACANIKKAVTFSNDPKTIKTLLNTGCAYSLLSSQTPALAYTLKTGSYPYQVQITTTSRGLVADHIPLTDTVSCQF